MTTNNIYNTREVLGKTIITHRMEIWRANALDVEAGTNGICGGDASHGSRTYFRIEDLANTAMAVNKTDKGFEVILAGDTEFETITAALQYIVDTLEAQRIAKSSDSYRRMSSSSELNLYGRIRQMRDTLCPSYQFSPESYNYFVGFHHADKRYFVDFNSYFEHFGEVYFDTREHAQIVCDILNKELKTGGTNNDSK